MKYIEEMIREGVKALNGSARFGGRPSDISNKATVVKEVYLAMKRIEDANGK